MSKDTIYREDAIKTLTENVMFEFTEDEEWAITCLQNLPSADRPQGEWKSVKASIYPYGYDVECSVCGHRMGSSFGYKFCPMCGAQMKGADYVLESDR